MDISIWVIFISVVLVLLTLDLGVLHKNNREIGIKESLWMSSFYMFIALILRVLTNK